MRGVCLLLIDYSHTTVATPKFFGQLLCSQFKSSFNLTAKACFYYLQESKYNYLIYSVTTIHILQEKKKNTDDPARGHR